MCGRFVLDSSPAELASEFELVEPLELAPRFNIAPSQDIAVVREVEGEEDGVRVRALGLCRWGLVPHWAKDPSIGHRMINARSESAAEKPAFRDALVSRRCLVPASGFYEWTGEAGRRRPFYFHPVGRRLFGIAGLWERWQRGDGPAIESCTLLTTDANARVAPIHDRMPVILEPGAYADWLSPGPLDPGTLKALLRPCAPERLESFEVSPRVNDVRVDDPACLEPCGQLSLL